MKSASDREEPPPSKQPRAGEPFSYPEADKNNLMELQQFCTAGEDIIQQEDSGPLNIPGALPGSARRHLLWDVKQIPQLKVHFLNPDVLDKENWRCGRAQLTVNNVLDWAAVWNGHAEYYPLISDDCANKEKAHIRISFTSDRRRTSWSKVGTAATWEPDTNKPTMVLNLYGMTKAEQRSMVIHEFGHALGLDHEHQRSDFWDVLEQKLKDKDGPFRFIIGIDEMKRGIGCQPACAAVFRANLPEPDGTVKTEYDSQSIMHYWFDENWLQPKYRDREAITKDQTLTESERKVLVGVHARNYQTGGQQAKDPSKLDYETLNMAYDASSKQKVDNVPVTNEISSDVDYSKCDSSKFYNTMVKCSVELDHAMSQEPKTLATALHAEGFISQSTLDETMELNETKSSKGSRLYSAVLGKVRSFPNKFSNFVQILRCNRVLYSDVLKEIDKVYIQ